MKNKQTKQSSEEQPRTAAKLCDTSVRFSSLVGVGTEQSLPPLGSEEEVWVCS